MKKQLLKLVQVTVTFFFVWWNLKNQKRTKKNHDYLTNFRNNVKKFHFLPFNFKILSFATDGVFTRSASQLCNWRCVYKVCFSALQLTVCLQGLDIVGRKYSPAAGEITNPPAIVNLFREAVKKYPIPCGLREVQSP